jgi:hypothetical protein
MLLQLLKTLIDLKMKQYLAILLFIICFDNIHAQKLNVESFVVKTNDITARTQPRQDINGNDCALIKVQLAASGAEFGGNVVGNVSYNKSEYLVYMSEGSKRLSVKLEGYLPLEASFEDYGIKALEGKTTYIMTISGASVARQIEAPRIKTGWIILESEPSGASVYINDEFVGNTPLNNYKQSYGTYQYRLESPNYHPATGTIELNAGRFEQRIALKPAFGSISVKSNVAGAKILLDGKPTGKNSPTTLTEIPSGSHTITLQSDKYAPQQQNVVVEDGQATDVSMSLDARFARITINSINGAEIYSNGKLLGKGRISEDLMEGYYDLEARLNHYKSITKQIQVVAGQPQDITLNPIPKYGSLDIVSTPHNATVIIDGKTLGKTPMTTEQLLEGEHLIRLEHKGYESKEKTITIVEMQKGNLEVSLKEMALAYPKLENKESFKENINEKSITRTNNDKMPDYIEIGKTKLKYTGIITKDGGEFFGSSESRKPNGFGRTVYKNGNIYEGNYVDGKRQGFGVWQFNDGERYQGEWYQDQQHGKGTYFFSSKNIYDGMWARDYQHGQGIMYYFNGDKYDGEWKQDKRSGKGTYTFADGAFYRGDWVNDKKNGKGFFDWGDGSTYDGEWKDNMCSGKGTFKFANGDVYTGQWLDDEMNGLGIYRFKNGDVYEGDYVRGARTGSGTYKYANGDKYTGQFLNGKRHGKGTFTWKNGDRYVGHWKADKQDGYGKLTKKNGENVEGYFKNGLPPE